MKRLIVNADDFGLHPSVNAGIAKGHVAGIITSASLMAGGENFTDAVRIAARSPRLGIGVHLTLVGGGRPVLPPEIVPSLVDGQGRFPKSHPTFIIRYLAGKIRLAEVEAELTAQVRKVTEAGLVPTHLDSHQHLHALPGIFAIVRKLAGGFGIGAIRKPAEALNFFGGMKPSVLRVAGRTGLSLLAAWTMRQDAAQNLRAPEHFFGMLAGGTMVLDRLEAIICGLPEGTSEVMTHPGADNRELSRSFAWGYHWEEELEALTSPRLKDEMEQRAIQLISFREL